MSVEIYRESPGKFDSRTLNRTTLNRWTGRICCCVYSFVSFVVLARWTFCNRLLSNLIVSLSLYIYIYIERERLQT